MTPLGKNTELPESAKRLLTQTNGYKSVDATVHNLHFHTSELLTFDGMSLKTKTPVASCVCRTRQFTGRPSLYHYPSLPEANIPWETHRNYQLRTQDGEKPPSTYSNSSSLPLRESSTTFLYLLAVRVSIRRGLSSERVKLVRHRVRVCRHLLVALDHAG